jgi:hypothetical protein
VTPVTRVDPFSLSDEEVYEQFCRPGVKRVLAEGDSWLSIFLPRDGNLLSALRSRHDVVLLDLSYPGDTLAEMAHGRQFELFERLVAQEHDGWAFDAILLNGGGNDLIGGGLERVLSKPARSRRKTLARNWIDDEALGRLLGEIHACFQRFIEARSGSTLNARCPILTCTYDFITPRNCGAQLLGVTLDGPWICPRMNELGIGEPALQKAITDTLLIAYRTRLLEPLAADIANNFHLADTQGTLVPASPDDFESRGDWADEIHPSARGWKKLAQRIGAALDALLD